MRKKTIIKIDYTLCGDGIENNTDPRECCKCLRACEPAIFLLHQTLGAREENPLDPRCWRITPLWSSLCTLCMKCVKECPVGAIKIKQG
jgi:NAD-dependent dihydropyrimidine dehydrogenase PreA subunit